MEAAFEGCYFLGNPGGSAGGPNTPYATGGCAGGGAGHCYQSSCCSHPKRVSTDPPNCMMCNGAFITLSATKAGVAISRGEVFGFSIINSFFDWGSPWYANTSVGHRAIAINETEALFNRSQITNTIVEGNTFTGVHGSATRLRRNLRLDNATLWSFDLCNELLFPPPSKAEIGRRGGTDGEKAGSMFAYVGYSIQIEDDASWVQHKLGSADRCTVRVLTDKATTATVFIEVDQSKESLQYVPNVPP